MRIIPLILPRLCFWMHFLLINLIGTYRIKLKKEGKTTRAERLGLKLQTRLSNAQSPSYISGYNLSQLPEISRSCFSKGKKDNL